jgi:DNA-binding CsgD family transcriptional regulator
MMSSNMTAKQMADQLAISHRTVQFHQDSMYWKLGISGRESRKNAVDKGRRLGIIK